MEFNSPNLFGNIQNNHGGIRRIHKSLGAKLCYQDLTSLLSLYLFEKHHLYYLIIHFDIKPHTILLGVDFTPKVCDFGLSKLSGKGDDHISMIGRRGTLGYVSPKVCDKSVGPLTDKSDVYSFGMLLLEIVGGRKNIYWKGSRSSQFYFPGWDLKLLESGELGIRLRGGEFMETEDEEKARRLTKVGLFCIQYNYQYRPCMRRVVQMLEGNGDDVTDPPSPFDPSAAPKVTLFSKIEKSSSI